MGQIWIYFENLFLPLETQLFILCCLPLTVDLQPLHRLATLEALHVGLSKGPVLFLSNHESVLSIPSLMISSFLHGTVSGKILQKDRTNRMHLYYQRTELTRIIYILG